MDPEIIRRIEEEVNELAPERLLERAKLLLDVREADLDVRLEVVARERRDVRTTGAELRKSGTAHHRALERLRGFCKKEMKRQAGLRGY